MIFYDLSTFEGEAGENNLNLVAELNFTLLTQCLETAFIIVKLASQV